MMNDFHARMFNHSEINEVTMIVTNDITANSDPVPLFVFLLYKSSLHI
jgi:hypothetical protein